MVMLQMLNQIVLSSRVCHLLLLCCLVVQVACAGSADPTPTAAKTYTLPHEPAQVFQGALDLVRDWNVPITAVDPQARSVDIELTIYDSGPLLGEEVEQLADCGSEWIFPRARHFHEFTSNLSVAVSSAASGGTVLLIDPNMSVEVGTIKPERIPCASKGGLERRFFDELQRLLNELQSSEPPTDTLEWVIPVISPLPGTGASQSRAGLVISVRPIMPVAKREIRAERREYDPLHNRRGSRYFEVTQRTVIDVEPSVIDFQVDIANQMDHVFRGALAVIGFKLNGEALSAEEAATSQFHNLEVVPGGHATLMMGGLRFRLLPDSAVVSLLFYDVVTETDAAANPIRRESFEWHYRIVQKMESEVVPLTVRYEAVHR